MQESPHHFAVSPADLPSPPAAVARVVRLASDPDITSEKLGAAISSDPAFTAELLRTVNSPFYGLKAPITAAARAVTVLGVRALRNLAICFAVRDSLRNSGFRAQDLEVFWEDCLRRGVAARTLARATGIVAPEEAFTLGLLQDFGMLAMLRASRKDFSQWGRWREMLPAARKEDELSHFGVAHDALARMLGERWGLPTLLVESMAWHHAPADPRVPADARELAKLAFTADLVGVLLSARSAEALAAARTAITEQFGIADADADRLLAGIAPEVEAAATALGMRVSRQPSFATVLAEANRTLVQMNTSYEDLTRRLEATLSEKEALMAQLGEANAALARLAYFDPLTGLCNRRHYDGLFRDMLGRASAEGKSVSVVMVDLDRFKSVNDTYGHATGDAVLRMASQSLIGACHDADIKARLGGEELAVVLPNTDAAGAYAAAERIREAIARGSVSTNSGPLRVTASFGVSTFVGSGAKVDIERLITLLAEVADKALYESKNNGRNRVTLGGVIR